MMDDSAFRPDMALPDIGLPKMNGHDAWRLIRSEPWGKDIVFIVLTGWSQEEDKRQSKETGFISTWLNRWTRTRWRS